MPSENPDSFSDCSHKGTARSDKTLLGHKSKPLIAPLFFPHLITKDCMGLGIKAQQELEKAKATQESLP